GNIDQTCCGIEGHRRPVVGSSRTRGERDGFPILIVMSFRIDDGPSGLRIDTFRPCDLREWLRGYKRAGNTIHHVIKAVLVGLHSDLALASIDGEIRANAALNAFITPG